MAKAQAVKPKSSIGDWFKRLGAPKPKPAARPVGVSTSTVTKIPGSSGPATRPGGSGSKAAGATVAPRQPKAAEARSTLARFRMPVIGSKPVTAQMQILGTAAVLLLAATAFMVYEDTTLRTRHATYVTIASQMQFHTQRLAKAAGIAARGQPAAFPQLKNSRDEFATYLEVLTERRPGVRRERARRRDRRRDPRAASPNWPGAGPTAPTPPRRSSARRTT